MAQTPTGRMGPPPRSFAADAHDCIMVRIRMDLPNTSSRREDALLWRAPLGSLRRLLIPRQTPKLPRDAHLAVHRPSACSGVKALRNTSDARRQAAKLGVAFRSLDPFRALWEPDRRRRDEERPFPLRTKNCQQNPTNNRRSNTQPQGKSPLTGESPIQVRCELVSKGSSSQA
jgi:hypothetical protein